MIVLDTGALILWLCDHRKLSVKARDAIEREMEVGELAISTISILDVATYVEDGRLELSVNTRGWLSMLTSIERLRIVPVDVSIAVSAANLPPVITSNNKLILATAVSLGAILVTPDSNLRQFTYGGTIW